MKTFNYESNCLKYNNCFFDIGEYENGQICLALYGYVGNNKRISNISNVTVNVDEKLPENQIVIDNYTNTNLITFLLELGIITKIVRRVKLNLWQLPVAEINFQILKEYCYDEEELRYVS